MLKNKIIFDMVEFLNHIGIVSDAKFDDFAFGYNPSVSGWED